jgi:pimeloyl-ACP methyl ester carboxylesterase
VRIGYTVAAPSTGASKTVLLIHGAPQTGYAWRHVMPLLVEAGYRVVVPDYGEPALPPSPATATTSGRWLPTCTSSCTASSGFKARSPWSALVPDAGHWVAEENPDGFTRMFLDFDRAARAA